MRKLHFYWLGIVSVFVFSDRVSAQNSQAFSLQQAQEYAIKNNVNNLNASLDDAIAKNYNKEIRGIGFPQINGSFDVKDFVEIPTSLIPAQFFGGPEGSFAPVKFGTQYNATAGLSASQIIFSSDYFLALKASKTLLDLSHKNTLRTGIETKVSVAKAYYGVLVFRERLKLMDANLERIKKLKDDTKALNENGFVEQIDLDRVELTYNNLQSEKEKLERLETLTECALKFQMGMEINTPISLTDSLNTNTSAFLELDNKLSVNYANRIEYQLLQNQDALNLLELKRYRLNYLPSIAAYGLVNAAAQRSEFDIFDTKKGWYPTGIVGATLNLPIFDGFQKHFKVEQAKLKIAKTRNSIKGFERVIDLEVASARTNIQNAELSLTTQKKNIALAENVYNVSKIKYTEGVGSNSEVVNAETALKEAQTNYYSALFDYIIAKIDWDKANGNIH